MSTTVKVITWVLLALWALFTVVFVVDFHAFVQHPLASDKHAHGGGLFLVLGQAALGAAVILI